MSDNEGTRIEGEHFAVELNAAAVASLAKPEAPAAAVNGTNGKAPTKPRPPSTPFTRERLHQSREALRSKEAAGEVAIETDGAGSRIVETRPELIPIRADVDPDTC